jgi:formiminotetrahydrofolate cyclodeaminase
MDIQAYTIAEFLSEIASENVAPAGGSAVAVTGAMGSALCEMTCIHTLNSNPSGAHASEITTTRDQLAAQRQTLLQLAGEDARVIETVFKGSDASQAEVNRSLGVPVSIAETCLGVLEQGATIGEWTDRAVGADANTGLMLANGSLRAAIFIANSNLDQVSDQSFVTRMEGRIAEIVAAADAIADESPALR